MEKIEWLHEELLRTNLSAETSAEAITILGTLLYEHGFVKESFLPAVLQRELEFSTGLPTADINVAIPHPNVEHILKPAVAVGIFDEPVPFREMGDPEGEIVPVRVVFMLAIHDPKKVIGMLTHLIDVFQTPGLLRRIVELQHDPAGVMEILKQHIDFQGTPEQS
jgi:galactitol PTS system EIIA component